MYQSCGSRMAALFSEDEDMEKVVVVGTKKGDRSVKPPVVVSRRLPRRSRSSEMAAVFGEDEDQEEVAVVWIKKVDNNMKPPVPDSKPAAQRSGAGCACPRPWACCWLHRTLALTRQLGVIRSIEAVVFNISINFVYQKNTLF